MCFGSAIALLMAWSGARAENRLPGNFVYLRDIDPSIRQDMRYATEDNFVGRPLPGYNAGECILRRPVALALKRVQADLEPRNLTLKVYDCYRPTRAVTAMVRWSRTIGTWPDTSRFHPSLNKARLFLLGYISRNSAHSRGIAVDATIVLRDAPTAAPFDPTAVYGACNGPVEQRAPDDSLDMGTGFDCFDIMSHTRNPSITAEQKANRTQLVEAMARRGFVNYRREWWHFTFPTADDRVAYNFPIEPR
ncbi:MAG: M15 family metallopeptidase [Pseudolabrys sp.]|nr:M15 family metallopeptidase [Pseudolabrys sp.]